MASHGDRKLFKVANIANVSPELISYLFEEFSKLFAEYPEVGQCVSFNRIIFKFCYIITFTFYAIITE